MMIALDTELLNPFKIEN
jgi:hypothetical protein